MSATGNLRNKVALKPGHSLMDWIRLGNSGEDLSGTGGAFLDVTPSQLSKHNRRDDAWLCIRGKVYNVTRYLDFHPGGVDELMKGVGTDATTLFNKIHPWVNYESILKKCIVGNLKHSFDEDLFSLPSVPETNNFNNTNSNQLTKNISGRKSKAKVETLIKADWYQQLSYVSLVFYTRVPTRKVHVDYSLEKELWVEIGEDSWTGWELNSCIKWPPAVTTMDTKVEVRLNKMQTRLWDDFSLMEQQSRPPNQKVNYWQVSIFSISQVGHNVFLIALRYLNRVYNYIPIGHHVVLKGNVRGATIERPYTPVCGLVEVLDPGLIWLIVKNYPDGMFSSWLTSLKAGDTLSIGRPQGSFSTKNLTTPSAPENLIFLAAGSGITPMIRLLMWALSSTKMNISLKCFNKTEQDIIWRSDFKKLSENTRFNVEYILSEADTAWKGRRGWITLQLLQSFLPDITQDIPPNNYVCVCGPISFTQLCERYLQDMGYNNQNYFCFKG